MMNTRKMWGGYCICSAQPQKIQKGGKGSVTLFPSRLPKGGQRWANTSDKGGVIYG